MQVFRRHKKIVLIAVLLVVILIVSFFIIQKASKPSPTTTPTPASTPTPSPAKTSPTPTASTSPVPTVSSPPTPFQTPTPEPSPVALYPGEVTQYEGQSLTPINDFIEDIAEHPDVAIMGTQKINQATYVLKVTGLVNNTLEYTYNDVINNFPSYQQVGTLLCVEGWGVVMLWQGVHVSDLLNAAGINSQASTIIFYAPDGYSTELPFDYIVQNNIILAYKVNNVTLPATLGFPFMLIAQNQYGYKWIKWVTEIDASSNSSYLGYWESRGYPNNATVGDPNNPRQNNDNVPVASAITVTAAGTVIAAVIYITLTKINTKRPKFWSHQKSG